MCLAATSMRLPLRLSCLNWLLRTLMSCLLLFNTKTFRPYSPGARRAGRSEETVFGRQLPRWYDSARVRFLACNLVFQTFPVPFRYNALPQVPPGYVQLPGLTIAFLRLLMVFGCGADLWFVSIPRLFVAHRKLTLMLLSVFS